MNQIVFEEKSIFVQIENDWVIVPAVFSDEKGFYIQEVAPWQSPRCYFYNYDERLYCQNCHLRRPDHK